MPVVRRSQREHDDRPARAATAHVPLGDRRCGDHEPRRDGAARRDDERAHVALARAAARAGRPGSELEHARGGPALGPLLRQHPRGRPGGARAPLCDEGERRGEARRSRARADRRGPRARRYGRLARVRARAGAGRRRPRDPDRPAARGGRRPRPRDRSSSTAAAITRAASTVRISPWQLSGVPRFFSTWTAC